MLINDYLLSKLPKDLVNIIYGYLYKKISCLDEELCDYYKVRVIQQFKYIQKMKRNNINFNQLDVINYPQKFIKKAIAKIKQINKIQELYKSTRNNKYKNSIVNDLTRIRLHECGKYIGTAGSRFYSNEKYNNYWNYTFDYFEYNKFMYDTFELYNDFICDKNLFICY